ncbi:uncharacterized protein [Drosophila bipectinata]|uniref:uncharacterized protein n=1 Tax=Drosophila bipectinata TaxID=42026 RepID=UPI0038B32301
MISIGTIPEDEWILQSIVTTCYAPTEDTSDDIEDDFYNALTSSLTRIERGDIKILMGDFNAKIGPNNNGLKSIMGRHGVGTWSNGTARDEHKELCKMVKKSARNDKRKFLDRLAENAESQIISQLTGSCHRRTQPVRDPDGRLLTDDEAQLQRWRQHFMEISCTKQPSSTQYNFSSIVPSNNLRISPTAPSIREIKDAIRKLKRNKAAGDDGIPAELLQINTQLMAETLHPHFNNI